MLCLWSLLKQPDPRLVSPGSADVSLQIRASESADQDMAGGQGMELAFLPQGCSSLGLITGCSSEIISTAEVAASIHRANINRPALPTGLDSEMLYRTSGSELRQALKTGKNQFCTEGRRAGSDG